MKIKHNLNAILLVLSCAADDLRDAAAATRRSHKKVTLEKADMKAREAIDILLGKRFK